MQAFIVSWLIATWEVLSMASPWLLFGFFLAGVIKVFLSPGFIARHLKEKGLKSVLKASAFGVPLPLCSCSVIPVAVSLRKSGASKGAVGSFLVSTPEIGVDSFILSLGMLGPVVAVLRALAAFFSAIMVGLLIDFFPEKSEQLIPGADLLAANKKKSCCENSGEIEPIKKTVILGNSLRYAFVDLVDDIAISLIVGFLAAGLISVLIPADFNLATNLSFFQQLFVVLLVSIPLYVCASSSTPIAAILLAKGMSLGVVLVFLLVGPATNIATVIVVIRELGKKAFFFYIFGISFVALSLAVILNYYSFNLVDIGSVAMAEHHHGEYNSLFSYLVAYLLLQSAISKILKKIKNR